MSKTAANTHQNENQNKKGRATSMDGVLGAQLRLRRTVLGISQEKLAEQIGVTFQQIQKYENGANRISASRLFELSKILNVPVSKFFESADFGQDMTPAAAGLSDNEQAAFEAPEDIMSRKETLDLIRVYYSIEDPKLRKDLFKLVRSMAENFKKQD
jgi:transcriptional regulator with XRE-family HTH domain